MVKQGDSMPKRTLAATRAQIMAERVNGRSQDQIAEMLKISKGVVNDTIQQCVAGTLARFENISDHVEECHRLMAELKNSGHNISDMLLGAAVFRKLHELGIEPKGLDICIKAVRKMAVDDAEASKMLEMGMKLVELEEKYRVKFIEIPDIMEQSMKRIENEKKEFNELTNKRAKVETELKIITREKQEVLGKAAHVENIEKRLAGHRMKLEDVDSFELFLARSKSMGYDTASINDLTKLAEVLAKRGKDSKKGLALLDMWLALEKQGFDLDTANHLGQELAVRGLKGKAGAEWIAEQCKKGKDLKKTLLELEEQAELATMVREDAEKKCTNLEKKIERLENSKKILESKRERVFDEILKAQKDKRALSDELKK